MMTTLFTDNDVDNGCKVHALTVYTVYVFVYNATKKENARRRNNNNQLNKCQKIAFLSLAANWSCLAKLQTDACIQQQIDVTSIQRYNNDLCGL